MSAGAVSQAYFDAMYAADPDPWPFESRWYEHRKRALTLAALPRPRYRLGLKPGCSIGVLTEQLAARCDHLVATDIAENARQATRRRVARLGERVEVRRWALGQSRPPSGVFDLIVASEVCYYLDAAGLRAALKDLVGRAEPDATVLFAHWRHPVPEYPLTGDQVHALARATPGLVPFAHYSDADLLLDVFTAGDRPSESVAAGEGLV